MMIDFNQYSLDELRNLNHQLIEHMRLRHQRASQEKMNKFNLGDQVCFESTEGDIIDGRIIRFNQKTVTIERDCGHQWRVSPQILERVVGATTSAQVQEMNASLTNRILHKTIQETPSKNGPCLCGSGKKFKRCCLPKNRLNH